MANSELASEGCAHYRSSTAAESYTFPEVNITDVPLGLDSLHLDHNQGLHDLHDLPELSLTDPDLDLDSLIRNCGVDSYIPDSDDTSSDYQDSVADSSNNGSSPGSSRSPTPPPQDHRRFPDLEAQPLAQPSTPFPSVKHRHANRMPSRKSLKDPDLVTCDGPNDPKNPHNWSKGKRWVSMLLVSSFTLISLMASTMVAPALHDIADEFDIQSDVEEFLVMTIFLLAYAVGPFLWGPLSEIFGRVKVLQSANMVFLLFNTVCGFAKTKQQMMAFRFLSGIGASAPQAIGGGVLSDCFRANQCGRAIAVYSLMLFISPAIGPIAGGYLTQHITWRWVFWMTSLFDIAVQILAFAFLDETFPLVLLSKKAMALRKQTGNEALHTKWQGPDHSMKKILMKSLVRPFIMLESQPALQAMALFRGYQYGLMYLACVPVIKTFSRTLTDILLKLATFPKVFEDAYDQGVGRASLNYLLLGIGFVIGLQISGPLQDKIYKYCKKHQINPSAPMFTRQTWRLPHNNTQRSQDTDTKALMFAIPRKPVPPRHTGTARSLTHDPTKALPEDRLPLTLPFSLLIPIGLFIYGWSAEHKRHWIFPNLGACILATGLIICFNCAQAYVVDTYTTYAASATGAAAFVRTMAGFTFPLFAPGMYNSLSLGWGNSLLEFVSLFLGIGAPMALWRWRKWLRERSTCCTD